LDQIFKIQPIADCGAKFRGHRPTVLGDTVAKRKKTYSAVKHKSALKIVVFWRTNNRYHLLW